MDENNLMLFMLLVISFFFLTIFFTVTLFLTYKKIKRLQELENYANVLKGSLSANSNTTHTKTNTNNDNNNNNNNNDNTLHQNQNAHADPTHLPQTLLLEILPSKSAKWDRLLSANAPQDPNSNGSGRHEPPMKPEEEQTGSGQERGAAESGSVPAGEVGSRQETVDGCATGRVLVVLEEEEEERVKKKKKKGKKKRVQLKGEEVVVGEENGGGRENSGMPELGCLCPLTSMGSATQRKIKELYHQLVQSCESNELTLAQVGEFTKCLAQAREELEDKSETIKRKFSIQKALLSKADRSSIDRLRQQIYNLEKQQRRLEEDVYVYNWLQDQLRLSPACKKMFEVCADMELKTRSSKPLENTETDEFADISFEELLAQEKKDSFWFLQRKLVNPAHDER
ncbi:hypothetical protein CUMW_037630 [Citrus unshiu]|nr:hypothetical protein CUMW_037630 [Citrus unshiu]